MIVPTGKGSPKERVKLVAEYSSEGWPQERKEEGNAEETTDF